MSPPTFSVISENALMNEIFVARKAFAATFTSSAVSRSVLIHGVSAASCRA